MISIKEFSIINIFLATFSLVTTIIALQQSIKYYKLQKAKIFLLYAGNMIGFIINIIAVFMGLIQVFIFGDFQKVPSSYCTTQGFIKISGLFLFNIYQILIDIALYLNIYNFKLYQEIFHKNIKDLQIYVYSIVVTFCSIFLILNEYGPNDPFIDIDCGLREAKHLNVSMTFILSIFFFTLQPLLAITLDIFVMTKIIIFYQGHTYQSKIKNRINCLILFPIAYFLITCSELIYGYFAIQSHFSVNPTSNQQVKNILQGFSYIIISSRGGIIACLFINLMVSSNQNNENIEFTVPVEDDFIGHDKEESLQMSLFSERRSSNN